MSLSGGGSVEAQRDHGDTMDAVVSRTHHRAAIAVVYVDLYNATPHEDWGGEDGTIRSVMSDLNISNGSRVVKQAFQDVQAAWADGREWSPEKSKKEKKLDTPVKSLS
jgi:hypothetical protein